MKKARLTRARFRELTREIRMAGPACRAAELHLCDGISMPAAARVYGITKQGVHKAVARLRRHFLRPGEPCPTCGEPIRRELTRARLPKG